MSEKRIKFVVLGKTGFIGSALIEHLQSKRLDVTGVSTVDFDLRKNKSVPELCNLLDENTALVVACGSHLPKSDPEYLSDEIAIAVSIGKALQKKKIRQCVYLSTTAVYGDEADDLNISEDTALNPSMFNGVAKFTTENLLTHYANANQTALALLRPCMVYGPGSNSTAYGPARFIWSAVQEKKIELFGDGMETRDYVYVGDFVKIIEQIAEKNSSGVFNVSSGQSVSFSELAQAIKRLSIEPVAIESCERRKPRTTQRINFARLTQEIPNFAFTPFESGLAKAYQFVVERIRKDETACLLCGAASLMKCLDDSGLKSVTSDCKPADYCPRTFYCTECGHLQKLRSAQSRKQVDRIYKEYEIYQLSEGIEQPVIDADNTGANEARSSRILKAMRKSIVFAQTGSLLDVGCGNGGLLKRASELLPGWELYGHELDDKHKKEVLNLRNVNNCFQGSLSQIQKRFDLITVVHVFEHVTEPEKFLKDFHTLLKPNGRLLIHVPNILENPFDMAVIDHYSHFAPEVLHNFVSQQGFAVEVCETDWVRKEISLVAQKSQISAGSVRKFNLENHDLLRYYARMGHFLQEVYAHASKCAGTGEFGIFGTAIAGTWLAGMLTPAFDFFVDEDETKTGKLHMGKPILHPRDLSNRAKVYIAFPKALARKIKDRLQRLYSAKFIVPLDQTELEYSTAKKVRSYGK